jgi:tripartite-type tricarboxylate transporter receptor subunit TctC
MKRIGILLGLIYLVLTYFFIQPPMVSSADVKYPTKSIKLVVPFSAGGPTDIVSRKLADLAGPYLGQEVIVENKTGAGGVVGVRFVAKSKPDGYTIGVLSPSPAIITPIFMEVDYDPNTDFTPIIQFALADQALAVRMDSPIKTFKDFIEEARKRELTIAGSGRTAADIAMERLATIAKLKLKIVPFGGTAPCITAVLGGQTDAIVNSGYYEHVRSGKLRLLCLATGMKNKEFQEIPTLKELGYDIEVPAFQGIFTSKGLPEQIRKKLEEAFARAALDPTFSPMVHNASWTFAYRNGEDFGNLIKEMNERSNKEYRELGLGKYAKEKK